MNVGDFKKIIENNNLSDDCIIKLLDSNGNLIDVELALPQNTLTGNGIEKPFDILVLE